METKGSNVKRTILIIAGVIAAGALATGAYYYFNTANKYKTVFMPGTVINSVDASMKTPEEVTEILKNLSAEYSLNVKSRGRDTETITAQEVGLHYVIDDSVDGILANQDIYRWFSLSKLTKEHKVSSAAELDESKLKEICSNLKAFDDSTAKKPVDAKLGKYDMAINAYAVIPCDDGNVLKEKDKAIKLIRDAILTLEPEINLDDSKYDLYAKAQIRDNNPDILSEKAKYDRFVSSEITYQDSNIVLNGIVIDRWLEKSDNGSLSLNREEIASYVDNVVALRYDTLGKSRTFTTAWGNEIKVEGGTYGWQVDREAEVEAIIDLVSKTSVTRREPVFKQKAATHSEPDWGDTYVEINIPRQHLYYWVDGKVLVDTDFVSGTEYNKTRITPAGVYAVKYKQHGAVLRGPKNPDGTYSYESPVTFWMPFNNGIGLHDATWRGSFGGNIYLYSGSHGCINLPYKKAQIIFNNIDAGCPVIVYRADTPEMTVEPPRVEETQPETKPQVTKPAAKKAKPAVQPSTQPAPQPETQQETQALITEETQPAEPETAAPPVETESHPVGPGFVQQETSQQEIGPGMVQ